jgi:site-specific recombinase XerC
VVALRQQRADSEWPGDHDDVFTSGAGTPFHANNLRWRVLKPAAEEAGAPGASFHTFRHTCASMLFASGRNAVQVQRWLGHRSAAFTLVTYVHLLDGDIGEPLALSAVPHANKVQTEATPLAGTGSLAEALKEAAQRELVAPATLHCTPGEF